jgi:RHS repeat-associated protein
MHCIGKGTVPVQIGGEGSTGLYKQHTLSVTALKSGYLYVYCSNESNYPVFFDNLSVHYTPGPIREETSYYPFGLTMQGISSKAAGVQESKRRFQGQELAHNEFSDGSGLEMYEFKWRMDDPQTGRFWQVDPLSEDYDYNSPYAFSENKVTSHIELEGLEAVKFWDNPVQWAATFGEGYFKGEGDAHAMVDGFNRMFNPLVDVYHAVTGKDYETNQSVSRTEALASLAITFVPGGKIEGAALKATEKATTKTALLEVNKTVGKEGEKIVTQTLEKQAGEGTKVISQVTGKLKNGGTTRYDNIVIDSKSGKVLFTNETKTGNGKLSSAQARAAGGENVQLVGKKLPENVRGQSINSNTTPYRVSRVDTKTGKTTIE